MEEKPISKRSRKREKTKFIEQNNDKEDRKKNYKKEKII